MMHLGFESYMPGALPPSYPYETMVDNTCSTQMALSQVTRRLSRASSIAGQRSGTTARVSKPNSTSTSPRSSKTARRRTMVNDAQSMRRHQQAMEYISATLGTEQTQVRGKGRRQQQQQQQPRPLSWHPSTHAQAHPSQYTTQQPIAFQASTVYYNQSSESYSGAHQYSPVMTTTYSSSTSPSSSFSSLPVSYECVDTMSQMSNDGWQYAEQRSSFYPSFNGSQYMEESSATLNGLAAEQNVSPNALDWNNFIMHGYSTTTPPTPDSFVQTMTTQLPQPAVSESCIQDLDETEDEGEILVGMGLYDDKYEEDPHLNNYRSTVTSLLGTAFRPQEPSGKGLKLEETWEPPKSDEEDEDEDDEDEEEDDEDEEEEDEETEN